MQLVIFLRCAFAALCRALHWELRVKIAILDDHQDQVRQLPCFGLLAEQSVTVFTHPARGSGQLAVRLQRFNAIVLRGAGTRLSPALLQKLPNLRYIGQIGECGDQLDLDAARARNIVVNAIDCDAVAPAELAWGLILAATRQIPGYASNLRDGAWQMVSAESRQNRLGRRLQGACLGIWGYGRIGRLVAGYGNAFGMRVLIWGSPETLAAALADGFETAAAQRELFQQADILSLHLRLDASTRGVVGAAELAAMQSSALLVNTSATALIATDALEQALDAGRPAAAALDLDDSAPPSAYAGLLKRQNILATPCIRSLEAVACERSYRRAFEDLLAFAAQQTQGAAQVATHSASQISDI